MNQGVVYVATGETCFLEASQSVASLKKHNPQLHTTLFTDKVYTKSEFDDFVIIEDPEYSILDKARHLANTPYEKTLFLDADTFVTDSLQPFFDGLKYCDFSGTLECARGFWYEGELDIPKALCEINGGVLCFRKTAPVMKALKQWHPEQLKTRKWLQKYGEGKWMLTNDQPSLRKLIWSNRDIRVAILPDEFNALRLNGTRLWGKAIVAHGRGDMQKISAEMNQFPDLNRVYIQGAGVQCSFSELSFLQSCQQLFKLFRLLVYVHVMRLLGK